MTAPSLKTAVVAGVGPGLGAALVRRFVAGGCRTAMLARSGDYLATLAAELPDGMTRPVPADL
ncbi:MAG: short-chain dehydrogenase, partial [Akkermansiaceae bacterium]|nr:short-chain dehydrogenase [Akkermansiaceae bacterium]